MSAAALESLLCDSTARKVHQWAMVALAAANDFCLYCFVVGSVRR